MEGFSSSNEKVEDKFIDLERQKLDVEKKKIELEKVKLESDERSKREERQHQFNMMKMIMGVIGPRPAAPSDAQPAASMPFYQAVPFSPPAQQSQSQSSQISRDEDSSFSISGVYSYFNL